MSAKDDASLDHPSNGQPLVVHHGAPLGPKDIDWGPVSAYARSQTPASTDASAYMHAIRRHWFLGLLLGVILAAAGTVSTWVLMPRYYTSNAFIRVRMLPPKLIRDDRQPYMQQEYDVYKATQAGMFTNPLVLTAALRDPKITSLSIYKREQPDQITWLKDALKVVFPLDSEIMQVSLTDYEQKEVAKMVDAVVKAYLREVVEVERSVKHRELADLTTVLANKEEKIRQLRTAMKQTADDLGTADVETLRMQMQFSLQQLGMYRSQLSTVQMGLRTLKAELEAAQEALKRLDNMPANTLELERLKLQDPMCRKLEEQLTELGMVQAQAQGKSRDGRDRLSSSLNEQATRLQAELNNRLQYLSEKMTEAARDELRNRVADFAVKVKLGIKEQQALEAEVEAKRIEFEKVGTSSVQLDMMKTDLDNLETVWKEIAQRRETLEVETNSPPRVQELQPAQDPQTYDNRNANIAMTVLAGIAGLVLPLGGLVFWDVRKRRINTSEDVAKGLGLSVIGSVPMIPGRAIKRLNSPSGKNRQWNIRLAESIDGIAAKLLRNAAIEQHRVVLITSAVSGEGKTTLATQVAMSLARAGRRTVLVDFDLRRPAIDKAFQLPLHPGVSEALCGESDVRSLAQPTGLPNLSVVTAGRCDRHVLQALANGADKRLFDELRKDHEFVIVDGSPILPVADSRYVSQHVDSVVLSVFRDYSRAPKVTAACEILEAFGMHDIEAVVTSDSDDGYGAVDTVVQSQDAESPA